MVDNDKLEGWYMRRCREEASRVLNDNRMGELPLRELLYVAVRAGFAVGLDCAGKIVHREFEPDKEQAKP